MKFVFFGTSEFGVVVLEKLVQAGYKPVLVVTTPDKPAGRNLKLISPPVKILAEQYSLPVAQPEKLGLAKFDLQNLAKPSFSGCATGRLYCSARILTGEEISFRFLPAGLS